MKKYLLTGILLLSMGFVTFSTTSAQMVTQIITIDRVWAAACPDAENTYAVRMAINNNGAIPVRMATASSTSITSAALTDGGCDGESLDGLEIPASTRFDMTEENTVWLVEMTEAYEAGTPFTLRIIFSNVEMDNMPGDATLAFVGVPILEEAPADSPLRVNAMSIWARPTVAEMPQGDSDEDMANDTGDMGNMGGMQMGGTSAVYMQIMNTADSEDFLIAGETEIPAIVEIHENIINENDVMMMRPVEGGVPIPAEGMQELRPGGYHVMLLEPAPMAPGDTILLTLEFESGESIVVAAPVEDRMMAIMTP